MDTFMKSLTASATEAEVNNTKNNEMMGLEGIDMTAQSTNSVDQAETQQATQVEIKPSHAPTSTASIIVGTSTTGFGAANTTGSRTSTTGFGAANTTGSPASTTGMGSILSMSTTGFRTANTTGSRSSTTGMGSILSTGAASTGAEVTATAKDKEAHKKQGLQTKMSQARTEAKATLESIKQINEELSVLIPMEKIKIAKAEDKLTSAKFLALSARSRTTIINNLAKRTAHMTDREE
jgi:hypothetical protein